MRSSFSLGLAACIALGPAALVSCGGGGGSPDCSDSADVSGHWFFTRSLPEEDLGSCSEDLWAEYEYTFELEPVERQLTIQGGWMEGGGSVCGTSVTLSFGDDEGFDWLHEESWDLELSGDGLTMTGTAVVRHEYDGVSCTVSGTVSGVFVSAATSEERLGSVLIINDERSEELLVFTRPLAGLRGRVVGLGVVPPGSAAVFPMPPSSWRVLTAYPTEGAHALYSWAR